MTRPSAATARRLGQLALAALWLLDAGLQLQPFMFGRGFAQQVITPSGAGQPAPVSASVHLAASLVAAHPVGWDLLFAAVQLAIGALLLNRRTVRLGLAGSFAWAVGVWWFGEGAGQVFSGQANLLTGAPGAVLLYLLVGVCVWPGREATWWRVTAPLDRMLPVPPRVARLLWLAMWSSGALLQLLPGQRSGTAFAGALTASPAGSPAAGFAHMVGAAAAATGAGAAVGVAAAYLIVGVLPLAGRWGSRAGLTLGALAALFIWVVGEEFGGLFTGQATDPNTGPLLLLFAFVLAARAGRPPALAAHPGFPAGVALARR